MIRFPIREPAWIKPLPLRRMGLALFAHGTTFCRDILRGFMSRFRFRSVDGSDIAPQEWLSIWSDRYPLNDYAGYSELIAKHKSLSAADFALIGKWKDAAKTEGKWKANVASVAYVIWMQAASELPGCPEETDVAEFLDDWSSRKYTDEYRNGQVEKHFGLSRTTTLLHFISGGRFPIF